MRCLPPVDDVGCLPVIHTLRRPEFANRPPSSSNAPTIAPRSVFVHAESNPTSNLAISERKGAVEHTPIRSAFQLQLAGLLSEELAEIFPRAGLVNDVLAIPKTLRKTSICRILLTRGF